MMNYPNLQNMGQDVISKPIDSHEIEKTFERLVNQRDTYIRNIASPNGEYGVMNDVRALNDVNQAIKDLLPLIPED